jgi:hypothetical protein
MRLTSPTDRNSRKRLAATDQQELIHAMCDFVSEQRKHLWNRKPDMPYLQRQASCYSESMGALPLQPPIWLRLEEEACLTQPELCRKQNCWVDRLKCTPKSQHGGQSHQEYTAKH